MYDLIKALIRQAETGKLAPAAQYATIIGHNERRLNKPVTEMTVDEIIAASDNWRALFGTTSGAAGAYQIIKPTLVQLKKDLGLTGTEKFTPSLQDRMADKLLQKRGVDQFLAGALSGNAFGNNLAREWASFPLLSAAKRGEKTLKRGQSYYDKFAGNSALITPAVVEATLAQMQKDHREVPGRAAETAPDAPTPYVPSGAEPGVSWLGVAIGALLAAFVIWYFFLR